ncbi:MAG: hypothetical protein NVS2B9_17820 [Myxococcales bacterium]
MSSQPAADPSGASGAGLTRAGPNANTLRGAALLAGPALVALYLFVAAWRSGTPPAGLGVREGSLSACPAKPNCVSDAATDEAHRVAPLRFPGSGAAGWAALKNVVRRQRNVTVVVEDGPYLRAEFRSPLFGFVDDLELLAGDRTASVRSASRVGTSDFGANRKRVEQIRAASAALRP